LPPQKEKKMPSEKENRTGYKIRLGGREMVGLRDEYWVAMTVDTTIGFKMKIMEWNTSGGKKRKKRR